MGYVTSKPGSRDYKKFTTYGKLKVGHTSCYFHPYSIIIQRKRDTLRFKLFKGVLHP